MRKNISTEWGPRKVAFPTSLFNNDLSTQTGDRIEGLEKDIQIQLSVHSIGSASFIRELKTVFPAWEIESKATIITTMQHASLDLVGIGERLESEKENLLEKFVFVGKLLKQQLEEAGHTTDYIDPCSGLPGTYLDGNTVYNEVQSAQTLLGYKMMNVGCCKVILHPDWGSAVFPASIVTLAPVESVIQVLEQLVQT